MPAPRRHELLKIAAQNSILIIEDDLDSEYRHVGPVLPSLWELAPESVIHLGTFAQVITSDARIGYVIAPQTVRESLTTLRAELGAVPSPIAQRAIANYLNSGGLRRQITKRRRDLVRRRAVVDTILKAHNPQYSAGAMVLFSLPDHESAQKIIAQCAAQNLLVGDLGEYWNSQAAGIVVGYGDVEFEELERALQQLDLILTAE